MISKYNSLELPFTSTVSSVDYPSYIGPELCAEESKISWKKEGNNC
jgi:hypothetical protein